MMTKNPDIKRAWDAFVAKTPVYDELWDYYDGNHPLRYSTQKLKEVFSDIDARFTENWCEVVVNAVADRLILSSVHVEGDEELSEMLQGFFDETGLFVDADDLHKCALVTGESYLVIWPEEGSVQAFYNDSRLVHLFYRPENPKAVDFAAKRWIDGEGYSRLTLYYADKIEYYRSGKLNVELDAKSGWKHYDPYIEALEQGVVGDRLGGELQAVAENPFGFVPIFQFRREDRVIKSEISPSVRDLQDAINKLLNDLMVSSEYAAFRQRYVISNAEGIDKLKNGPNVVWDLPSGDGIGQQTTVGEFGETDLSNITNAIDGRAQAMGRISRTPANYFMLGARQDPSGEALLAMEAPLNQKCKAYIRRLRGPWRQVARAMLMMMGVDVQLGKIKIVYESPRTVQPLTQSTSRQQNVNSGIPLRTQLRYEGWTETEIRQMEADRKAEQAAQADSLATALLNQQQQFDQEDSDNV